MNIEIEFNYQGQITIIQCNTQDNLNNIFQNFINKANIDINLIYFLYSGNIIEGNSIIEKIINSTDKERKKMNILVNNKDDPNENIMIIKPKDISCPKCGEISRINITDYKILLQCKNGHNKGNILLNEYKNTQKLDISKIICDECKIKNKSNTYENIFYRCNKCKINLCPLCKDNHNKEHKIINYEEKDYICKEHNQKYTSYCEKCKKNLCLFCEQKNNEDKNEEDEENKKDNDEEEELEENDKCKEHKIINYVKLLPNIKKANNNNKELKNKINKFKNIIDDIIIKLNKVKENIDYFYDINNDILNSLNNNNINYEILYNYNKIKDIDIINDINKINNNNLDNNNIINILNIYDKMINRYNNKIIINYNIKDGDKIKLFDEDFVKNNKDNCKIKIEDKEYELMEYFNINNLKNKNNNILSIELKGIENVTNMSYMFYECSLLNSLDLSNFNTKNVIYMNNMFSHCSKLISLNLPKFKSNKVINMSYMFCDCSSLTSLNLSNFKFGKNINYSWMLYNCSSLSYLNLSNLNSENMNNMVNIFKDFNNCKIITKNKIIEKN